MKTTNNTILITGGSAGIGLEIASLFSKKDNHVIIVGRNKERLQNAAEQLKKQDEAVIVNVSSIVAFVPGSLATYSASKAALHSYTQSLRINLEENSSIKVFELMPPLVDTDFSVGIGGRVNGIHPSVVAEDLIKAMEKNEYEIHVGKTADLYKLFHSSPAEALKFMNSRNRQLVN